MESQQDLLFPDGLVPDLAAPDPLAGLYADIKQVWKLPIGRDVQIDLKTHDLSHLAGRLDLARAPNLPLDPYDTLRLRIGRAEFTHRQIAAWSLR